MRAVWQARHGDRILPSDVALAPDGALVFSQTAPEPAVRRVDPETGLVATLVR